MQEDSNKLLLDNPNVEVVLEHPYLKHIIFLSLVALSIIGDLISEAFPRESRFFWLMMVFIFALSTFTLEASRIKKLGISGKRIFQIQVIHWGGTALAVITVLFVSRHHLLSPVSAGLVIHIILAMATFLTGLHLGWKFYLLGFMLFIFAGLAAYDFAFISTFLGIIIPAILLGLYLEDHSVMPTLRKK